MGFAISLFRKEKLINQRCLDTLAFKPWNTLNLKGLSKKTQLILWYHNEGRLKLLDVFSHPCDHPFIFLASVWNLAVK